MLANLNPYDETSFRELFTHHHIYKKLNQELKEKNLSWKKFFLPSPNFEKDSVEWGTPRANFNKNFSLSVFYYILPLLEKNYSVIYDLGCGKNMFKPYIPRLLGIGAESLLYDKLLSKNYNNVKDDIWPSVNNWSDFQNLPADIKEECIHQHNLLADSMTLQQFYGDIHGLVDDKYILEHQNYFESVFSICALHFYPINYLSTVIENFASMIAPGGRGFIGINLQRMIDYSSQDLLYKLFGTTTPSSADLDTYIRIELDRVRLSWLIVDIDLTMIDDGMDGNIRLVFEK